MVGTFEPSLQGLQGSTRSLAILEEEGRAIKTLLRRRKECLTVRVSEYHDFVRRTDQSGSRPAEVRRLIALYGVVSEIGSVGSAIKKKLLGEDGDKQWNKPNDEVVEELGDAIWYCFSLAQIENGGQSYDVLLSDLEGLHREISGTDDRAETIRATLNAANKLAFLNAYAARPPAPDMQFDDYQQLAFLTARTKDRELVRVCMAVLWQLGAELLRKTLPDIELSLNQNVADRPVNVVLGEIAWHLCAVASVLDLSMSEVIDKNVHKVTFRANRDAPTTLHDEDREGFEQLPRRFQVGFVSIGKGKSRMYLNGRQLGDDLDDNYREDDGYRFHDVMHLANVAHLGWSPVVRKLMGKKRKSRNDQVDEVEDGARAQIVEELVLKAIHSEGKRLADESNRSPSDGPTPTFPARGAITFRLLKSLRGFVDGLEAWNNQYWEWEDAIFDGSAIYYKLRLERQGTVTVDMNARTIEYSPEVSLDLRGVTVGVGMGRADANVTATKAQGVLTGVELGWVQGADVLPRTIAAKHAIYAALKAPDGCWKDMDLKLLPENRVYVRARGPVQRRMWEIGAISFQLAFAQSAGTVDCTAIAIADAGNVH
jgi:NTP pyrophosphatase (non-canonical NTP hydrolase)